MVRKPYRKRRFNLRRVRTSSELTLGTLAADATILGTITGTGVGPYRVMSVKATFTSSGLTEGEGPITIGLAHSDYSTVEVNESLDSFAAIDQGDKIAQERAGRLVRIVGALIGREPLINLGRQVSVKLNWLISPGDSVVLWARNEGPAALTTGGFVQITGSQWIKDV